MDTEVHTYTVDGTQLTGDVYELEVDDLTEDVQRGGLTIQKLDSETGATPQGDAIARGDCPLRLSTTPRTPWW